MRASATELGLGEPVMGCPDPAYVAMLVTDRLKSVIDVPITAGTPATVILHGQPVSARLLVDAAGKESLGFAVAPLGARR